MTIERTMRVQTWLFLFGGTRASCFCEILKTLIFTTESHAPMLEKVI